MKCSKCGKEIGTPKCPPQYQQAYQVRVGYIEYQGRSESGEDCYEFLPDEDVGYYCSECLKEGV